MKTIRSNYVVTFLVVSNHDGCRDKNNNSIVCYWISYRPLVDKVAICCGIATDGNPFTATKSYADESPRRRFLRVRR